MSAGAPHPQGELHSPLLCVELRRDLNLEHLPGSRGVGHGSRNQASAYTLCQVDHLRSALWASLPQFYGQDWWSRTPSLALPECECGWGRGCALDSNGRLGLSITNKDWIPVSLVGIFQWMWGFSLCLCHKNKKLWSMVKKKSKAKQSKKVGSFGV